MLAPGLAPQLAYLALMHITYNIPLAQNTSMSFETPLPPYNASDPFATFLNTSCLDLLLIELVPMATRLASELSINCHHSAKTIDEEGQKDAAYRRLETMGYRVGQGLVER